MFGSKDWIDEVHRRLADVTVDEDLALVIEQRLTDDDASWHVTIRDGRVAMAQGSHAAPTLRLSTTRRTAEAIHTGERSVQRAFLDGELQIGGDIPALIAHRPALAAIAKALAPR